MIGERCRRFVADRAGRFSLHVGDEPVDLAGHMEALEDPSGALSLEDVAFGEEAQNFSPVRGNYNAGFARPGGVWIRFSIIAGPDVSDEESSRILALNPPNLDKVRVYVAKTGQPNTPEDFDLFVMGASEPYELRPIRHPGFLVPITWAHVAGPIQRGYVLGGPHDPSVTSSFVKNTPPPRRWLDPKSAEICVSWKTGDRTYRRTVFADAEVMNGA